MCRQRIKTLSLRCHQQLGMRQKHRYLPGKAGMVPSTDRNQEPPAKEREATEVWDGSMLSWP